MNDGSASLDSFIDKWRQRWPEWGVMAVFVPQPQRATVAAWFALLQELRDAAWAGSDPAPGLAKLAWWQEELRGWSRGARRHPLGEALQKLDAPWGDLGGSLSVLPATRSPASQADDTMALEAFSHSLLACERSLFGGDVPTPRDVAAAVALLRGERALAQGDREGAAALAGPEVAMAVSRPRRLQQAVVQGRLRQFASGQGQSRLPALRLLFTGWRVARQG